MHRECTIEGGNPSAQRKTHLIRLSMTPAIILMAAILSLQSCCHKIYPSTSQTTSTIETITEIIRDTVIQTQPDTAILQALIRCDSTGRASGGNQHTETICTYTTDNNHCQRSSAAQTNPNHHNYHCRFNGDLSHL